MIIDRLKRMLYGGGADGFSDERQNAAIRAVAEDLDSALGFFEQYRDTDFNITAAIAAKLANIACAEAGVIAEEDGGKVAELLTECAGGLRRDVAEAFGAGGIVLRPYISGGTVFTERIPQSRFFVIKRCGERLIKAGFIAESRENSARGGLLRIETHELADDGSYIIENRAFEGEREVALSSVPDWARISPRTVLEGVSQMLFAHLKSPVVMRGAEYGCVYGAPVTYGQDRIIGMITALLNEIPLEYRNKRAFIGAEDLLFDSRDRLPESGVYKLLRGGGGERSFWEVFSPEIRHTSYFEGLDYLFGLLEKGISVNKGILTDMDSSDATATAIRRSMFDTYNLIDAMRGNIERAYKQLAYAYSVLCGEEKYESNDVRFSWSYSLLEDTSETFSQLMEGFKAGIVSAEEVRRFLF